MSNEGQPPLAAIAADYDAIAYDALPYPMAHPDNLAAVATMFGATAAPIATARVLDIGCNDGANLLPMAAAFPRATFLGCDIAPAPIRKAQQSAAELALTNVRFVAADLAAIDEGPFDYIIAHGLYAWVPAPVREALFALLARALAPNGLAYVSYNTYPGSFVRQAASEALRWHTRNAATREAKLAGARALAALLGEPGPTHEAADASVRSEFARIATESDSALYHDTLVATSAPVWFHAVVEHAARYGLAYVAEAAPSMMAATGLASPLRRFLAAQDRLAREQYLDIARLRRFRQSILARAGAEGDGRLHPARAQSLHASASMPLMRTASDGQWPTTGGADAPTLRALLTALVEAAPRALPIPALCAGVPSAPEGRPATAVLLEAWVSGLAQFHAVGPQAARNAGRTPCAARIARWQAPQREDVTNLRHETIRLVDPFARALLPLCDGTRDRAALATALSATTAQVDETLATFAQCALLEPSED